VSPAAALPIRILVCDPISDAAVAMLRGHDGVEVEVGSGFAADELSGVIGDRDALIVRSATKVDAAALEAARRLKVIGRAGAGVDNIDLEAAARAGVVVMNAPGANSIAAAELTLAHLLALARHLPHASADLREGRWERKRHQGSELFGKTLGIVGLGRIGREVARRAAAFGMELVGHDPFVDAGQAARSAVRWLPLEQLLAEADFVTLHLPHSAATHHLIDGERLAAMKPGARLINCARGGLVDEEALLDALESGTIAGAGLDVFEQEPPRNLALPRHPRVVATPHLGASTREAQDRVGAEIAGKILDYLTTGKIVDAVNGLR
jgi:D-3-phosphoglycerate dehydrogenase